MIHSTVPPARFRRPRIALVGFGDVAARIQAQRGAVWGQSPLAPRILGVSRSKGWDLDDRRQCRRLAACASHWIILVPPQISPQTEPQTAAAKCSPSLCGPSATGRALFGCDRSTSARQASMVTTVAPASVKPTRPRHVSPGHFGAYMQSGSGGRSVVMSCACQASPPKTGSHLSVSVMRARHCDQRMTSLPTTFTRTIWLDSAGQHSGEDGPRASPTRSCRCISRWATTSTVLRTRSAFPEGLGSHARKWRSLFERGGSVR